MCPSKRESLPPASPQDLLSALAGGVVQPPGQKTHQRASLSGKAQVQGKHAFAAEAPGYGRMSYYTGSIYWHYTDRRGSTGKVDRREIANAFLGITDEITEPEFEQLTSCS